MSSRCRPLREAVGDGRRAWGLKRVDGCGGRAVLFVHTANLHADGANNTGVAGEWEQWATCTEMDGWRAGRVEMDCEI